MASTLVTFLDGVGHEPHAVDFNGNYTALNTDVRGNAQGGTGLAVLPLADAGAPNLEILYVPAPPTDVMTTLQMYLAGALAQVGAAGVPIAVRLHHHGTVTVVVSAAAISGTEFDIDQTTVTVGLDSSGALQLGTHGHLLAADELFFLTNLTGGSLNATLNYRLGATLLFAFVVAVGAGATINARLRVIVSGRASANAQVATGRLDTDTAGVSATTFQRGTAAENGASTSGLVSRCTLQLAGSSASFTAQFDSGMITKETGLFHDLAIV